MWEDGLKKKKNLISVVRMATGGHCCEHKSGNSRVAFLQPSSRFLLAEALEYVTAGVLTCFQLAMKNYKVFWSCLVRIIMLPLVCINDL